MSRERISQEEITNRIYDTLMQNVGMSRHHVAFNPEHVATQEVDARKGRIEFVMMDGDLVVITVRKISSTE